MVSDRHDAAVGRCRAAGHVQGGSWLCGDDGGRRGLCRMVDPLQPRREVHRQEKLQVRPPLRFISNLAGTSTPGFPSSCAFLQRTGYPRRFRERVAPYSEEEAGMPADYRCPWESSPLSTFCVSIRKERATLPATRMPTLAGSNTTHTNMRRRRGGKGRGEMGRGSWAERVNITMADPRCAPQTGKRSSGRSSHGRRGAVTARRGARVCRAGRQMRMRTAS